MRKRGRGGKEWERLERIQRIVEGQADSKEYNTHPLLLV
jgi:hypothetical protein